MSSGSVVIGFESSSTVAEQATHNRLTVLARNYDLTETMMSTNYRAGAPRP